MADATSKTIPRSSAETKPLYGYLAAALVVLVWSSWLVASRSGAQSALTVYDLAAMRYGVSAVVSLPFLWYFKPWRSLSWQQIVSLAFMLGPIYIFCVFKGFEYAPAAHGGIFMNGALPAITLLLAWFWLGEKAQARQLLGVVLIILGAILAALDAAQLSLAGSLLGDGLFIIAAIFFAAYLVAGRVWSITSTQVLLCSSLVNALIFVPIWWLWLPSGVTQTSNNQLWFQLLFQGMVPNIIGLLLIAYALRHIGSAPTAAFLAAVPATGSILSWLMLGERLGMWGWLSILVLTLGIILVAFKKRGAKTV